jgi:hypothetical protein
LYIYYNPVQITQQRELNVGCYSPEFWTSTNPYVPPFAQPSDTQHAIREIYWPAVTEPHHRAYYKTFKTSHGIVVKSFRHGATGPWFESKTIVVLFFFQFNCDNYNLKPEELKIIKRDILIF